MSSNSGFEGLHTPIGMLLLFFSVILVFMFITVGAIFFRRFEKEERVRREAARRESDESS